jgi:hypothetical protein
MIKVHYTNVLKCQQIPLIKADHNPYNNCNERYEDYTDKHTEQAYEII